MLYVSCSPKLPIGNLVKHLLIIISFLLLSSPLFGQETGVLYLLKEKVMFLREEFADGEGTVKYSKTSKYEDLGKMA